MLFNTQSTLLVSTALFAANSVAQNGFKVVPRGSANGKLVGCYSSAPGYGSSKDYTYQSSGWCLNKCYAANSAAFALTGGSTCMCGDTLPPDSDKVDSSKCNRACTGWPSDMCGGSDYYSIYTTNFEDDVPTYSESSSTTTTSSSESTSTKTDAADPADTASTAVSSTSPQQTTQVTSPKESSASASVEAETKSSHNTAAIAAGVVIGVVGFAALCGAGFFFWRSKQNKTNAAFGGGTTGGYGRDSNPPSMSDSRFDGDYMAQRRQSNGSIDDDHDFSRRILQVTNPDR